MNERIKCPDAKSTNPGHIHVAQKFNALAAGVRIGVAPQQFAGRVHCTTQRKGRRRGGGVSITNAILSSCFSTVLYAIVPAE